MRILGLIFVGIAGFLLLAPTAGSEELVAHFWLSNRVDGPETPSLQTIVGDTRRLALWGRPAPGENLQGFSLNLTGAPFQGVELQQAIVLNPALPAENTRRFQTVFDSDAGLLLYPEGTYGFNGFTVINNVPGIPNGAGIGPECNGDPACVGVGVAASWLLGYFTFEAQIADSTSDWYLGISKLGLLHTGSAVEETLASFGTLEGATAGQPDVPQAYIPPNGTTGPSGFRDLRIAVMSTAAASQTNFSGGGGATLPWHDSANWSNGVPTPLQTAVIDLPLAPTVVLSEAATARHVTVRQGMLQVVANASLEGSIDVLSIGKISGDGWIMGDLVLNGDASGGSLVIAQEEPLHVLGVARVDGASLEIDATFRPPRGLSQTTILTAFGGIDGNLNAPLAELPLGLELRQLWHYDSHIVAQLYYESADFDEDSDVDGDDFLLLQAGWGGTGIGDANGDGLVGKADLDVWQAQLAHSPNAAAFATAVVPEPEALEFVCLATVGCLLAHSARRRKPVEPRANLHRG